MENQTIKFAPNVPTTVTMQYDTPKIGEGQYGTWYMYGCTANGADATFFASKGLHERLASLGALTGRTLVINKVVDEQGSTRWVIAENGQELDITPVDSTVASTVSTPNTPQQALGGSVLSDKALNDSKYIQGIITKIKELEGRIDALESKEIEKTIGDMAEKQDDIPVIDADGDINLEAVPF